MPRILKKKNNTELIISIPKGRVAENKSIIYLLLSFVGFKDPNETETGINNAQIFSAKYCHKKIILILNKDGVSFTSDKLYYGI